MDGPLAPLITGTWLRTHQQEPGTLRICFGVHKPHDGKDTGRDMRRPVQPKRAVLKVSAGIIGLPKGINLQPHFLEVRFEIAIAVGI